MPRCRAVVAANNTLLEARRSKQSKERKSLKDKKHAWTVVHNSLIRELLTKNREQRDSHAADKPFQLVVYRRAMGGGISKKNENTMDVPLSKRPPHDTGKFLLHSLVNGGNSSDGSGGTSYTTFSTHSVTHSLTLHLRNTGTYLSLSEDGQLCGAQTENDPELWRLSYENKSSAEQPKQHDLLRLTNTGRKRVLCVDAVTRTLSSVTDDGSVAAPNQLFYLLQAGAKEEGFYLIRSNSTLLFLSHTKDNVVTLSSDRHADDVRWKLLPSF